MELVDTRDLKSLDRNIVPVQVRPRVPCLGMHILNFSKLKYKNLIEQFKDKGYKFVDFSRTPNQKKEILLRHDIDFDIGKALEIALLENQLNVASTYFFLIRSDSYNFSTPENIKKIKEIYNLGHKVSIHFDSTLYSSAKAGFTLEKNLFKLLTNLNTEIVSFHRPNNFYLDNNDDFFGVPHTYQDRFFKDIKYISDSGGGFFYDHPTKCDAFKNFDSMQFLTHPIWWTTKGDTNIEKIQSFLKESSKNYSVHFAKNCKPWKEFVNKS